MRIVVLGDSLAFGTGASAPRNAFIFRAFLRVRAQQPGSRIDNFAIGGSTAADVLRLQAPRLAHARADVVVICVGGNDVVHRVGAADFARTYAQLVARVRALQPHAAIVCCGVPGRRAEPALHRRRPRRGDAACRAKTTPRSAPSRAAAAPRSSTSTPRRCASTAT